MKSIEAFTLGKKRGHPEANEDSIVVAPGVGYAVIDGVTDRDGTLYRGKLAGKFASQAAAAAIGKLYLELATGNATVENDEHLIGLLTEAVAAGYHEKGCYDAVRANPSTRAGCAVVMAFVVGDVLRMVSVGDSGIRINGRQTMQGLKPLDDVTARLRRETWQILSETGYSEPDCDRLALSVTWQGTRNQPNDLPTSTPEIRDRIEARAMAVNREALPDVPEAELLKLIHHGIVNGQGSFQNVTDRALGYGVIDGFDVPSRFIERMSVPLAEIETVELFSDGYFSQPSAFGISAWEAEFDRVEAEDPHKIGRYMSTKGTTETALTDDRTYLGVRWK